MANTTVDDFQTFVLSWMDSFPDLSTWKNPQNMAALASIGDSVYQAPESGGIAIFKNQLQAALGDTSATLDTGLNSELQTLLAGNDYGTIMSGLAKLSAQAADKHETAFVSELSNVLFSFGTPGNKSAIGWRALTNATVVQRRLQRRVEKYRPTSHHAPRHHEPRNQCRRIAYHLKHHRELRRRPRHRLDHQRHRRRRNNSRSIPAAASKPKISRKTMM